MSTSRLRGSSVYFGQVHHRSFKCRKMAVFRSSETFLHNFIVRLFVCYKALVRLFVFDEQQDITYKDMNRIYHLTFASLIMFKQARSS